MQRKLATIRKIEEVKPIPEADKICAYRVDGWWIVDTINKYQVNDLVIYCEVDSWVPHKIAPFLSKCQEPREYNGVKGQRLKSVKLRNQISQGLLLPISEHFLVIKWSNFDSSHTLFDIGDDVTEILGIQKWEPPIPAQLQGMMKGNFPHFIPKTYQERCQNLRKDIFENHEGETYEVTVKLDGSSTTIYVKDSEVGVCSRNIDLKETEGNSFWKAARGQNLIDALQGYCDGMCLNLAIQGELIGEGIQGNPEKLKGQRFYLFDVYNITEGRYLEPFERYTVLNELKKSGADIEHVPIIDQHVFVTEQYKTIDDLLNFAEGPSLNPQTKREGIVFKSWDSDFTFKAIANSYLLKHKDR